MAKNKKWKFEEIPDQSGKIAIVTGANSGLGYEVAKALARKGAHVVTACRNLEKAEGAKNQILSEYPEVSIEIIPLDLSDLSSVRKFAEEFKSKHERLDILCNNAGVMMTPQQKTTDGFEMQFGTNHLGHFALTGLLLDLLINTVNSRIVTMSSFAHKLGEINFEDINLEKDYNRTKAYEQSKLANLLFAYELQRKLKAAGKSTISNASHPGWTRTNLQKNVLFFRILNPFLSMKPSKGALSMLYAATAPVAEGGKYYGPGGHFEIKGYPKEVKSNDNSHALETAKRLWELSEKLTGITYSI